MLKKSVVIVAGGAGKRMGSDIPKQFLLLQGRPILMHTLERFRFYDPEMQIVLVLPSNDIEFWEKLCIEYKFKVAHTVVIGGRERFFSVKNGLLGLAECDYVAIHDGVRPIVGFDLITRCFSRVVDKLAVIPVVSPVESIRFGAYDKSSMLDREKVFLVQTPQVFKFDLIMKAYQTGFDPRFTDDASVVENYGVGICLVEGDPKNIKITNPLDVALAELYLHNNNG